MKFPARWLIWWRQADNSRAAFAGWRIALSRHYGFPPDNVEWGLQQGDGSNKLRDLQRSKTSVPKSESYSDFPESETVLRRWLNFLKEKGDFCRAQGVADMTPRLGE